jgi:flagellin
MTVINTNLNSLFAQNSLAQVSKSQSSAMQQLSTGQRINSAKDDAAGLAIATRMTSDINGFGVAVQNSNQGMNMAQTADGALNNVNNILQTMRQLAVQASNGTMTAANRQATQAEVAQLTKQIDSISQTTTSNGIQLLNGTAGNIVLQTGVNQGNTMTMSIGSVQTKDIGIGSLASLTSIQSGTTPVALTAGDLLINGVQVGASLATSDTLSYSTGAAPGTLDNSGSSIAKAAAINKVSTLTGVTATVDPTVVEGSSQTTVGGQTGTFTINGVTTASITTGTDATINRQMTITAINNISGQTGVSAIDTGDQTHGIQLVAADGRNITALSSASMTDSGLNSNIVTTAQAFSGQIELHSTTNSPITIGTTPTGTLANSGLALGTYDSNTAQVVANNRTPSITAAAAPNLFTGGTLILNGVAVGASLATYDTSSDITAASSQRANSGIAIAAAINKSTSLTGVSAVAQPTSIVGSSFTAAAVTGLTINGISIAQIGALGSTNTKSDFINAINSYTGQTGVVATDNNNGITYTAADGRNISIGATTASTGLGMSAADQTKYVGASAAAAMTTYSNVQLLSQNKFTVGSGQDGNVGFSALGFQAGSYGGSNNGLKINQVDVSTQSGAQSAITAIDAAISTVSAIQSNVGAYENRLSSTVTNLQSMSTNMSSSRSTIQDTNYSTTTTALARSQIISQAATAMLAQANQSGQTVLSLLK